MRRLGIMGGTFDPVHYAHVEMARQACSQAGLDFVWFMPSKNPPHKQDGHIRSEKVRSDMVKLAIAGEEKMIFSDYELCRDGITYSADTLESLCRDYPDDEFYFIMGGDSFFQIENWYMPDVVMKKAVLLVAGRDGVPADLMKKQAWHLECVYGAKIKFIEMDDIQVSSTMIRELISQGMDASEYVGDEVWKYILENKLYIK